MEDGNVALLVDAKEEYTKQLVSILKPCIYQGIKSIYIDAKDICHQDNTPDNVLMVFQDLLSRIPKWSQDIITKEYDRISSVSKCDYIDDLLKVVYVSHIKVLTIVHSAQRNKKISIKVPSGSHFIHLCYIECAREFWKDPYLFSDRVSKYEYQKNMRDSETMISECIAETIRKQLPVRHILKEFLNEPDEEIEEEDEDIKEPVNKKYLKKLETVVKKELKNSNKGVELDMDLIRKVIREEMDSRSLSTAISETSVIKKELVDTVVEKIVEQSNNETVEKLQVAPIISDTIILSETNPIKDISIQINTNNISEIPNTLDTPDTPNTADTHNTLKIQDTPNTIDTIEINTTEINTTEISGESLNNLLNDLDNTTTNSTITTDTNTNTKDIELEGNIIIKDVETEDNTNTNIVDIKMDSIKDEIATLDNDIKPITTNIIKGSSNTLVINNIDEVNLNLDELDSELGGDIDLDSLQSVDLKQNSNEIKKDPNTKYIFYKDT